MTQEIDYGLNFRFEEHGPQKRHSTAEGIYEMQKKHRFPEAMLWNHEPTAFHLASGDEVAYEHVKEERVYYIDTLTQRGILVLPHRPRIGFQLTVSDRFASWMYYPLIIHRNGNPIMGIEENVTCDVPNAIFVLEYMNPVFGWRIHQQLDRNLNIASLSV